MAAIPTSLRRLLRSYSPVSRLSLSASFSSSSANPRVSTPFVDEEEEQQQQGLSSVYKNKLRFQRPSSVQWVHDSWNSVSFIGTVVQPLKSHEESGDRSAYTVLRVRNSPQSQDSFLILLKVENKMAKTCFKHLKENDYIYVSGRLGTIAKVDQGGNLKLQYKVHVKELNYVAGRESTSQNNEDPQSVEGELTILEKHRDRLHLWQVFFSSPYEWWDNRKCKTNPNQPDFRHKDTGEALWLSPNDPPWVAKQIQRLDSSMAYLGEGEPTGRRARISRWEFDG